MGIQWSIKEDSFRFNNTLKDQSATQRGILSSVASLYDPLGFLEPYVLNGKRILQEMCNQGTGWDEPLPERLKPRWESWQRDFTNLQKINITRCYLPADFGEIVETELRAKLLSESQEQARRDSLLTVDRKVPCFSNKSYYTSVTCSEKS